MKNIWIALAVLVLATLACATSPATPKPSLFPTATAEVTQTPFVVQITTTPIVQVVEITQTPNSSKLCVNAQVAVNLRPSPSDDNYPIQTMPNGSQLIDLGGRNGGWFFVQFNDKQGGINSDYLGDCQ